MPSVTSDIFKKDLLERTIDFKTDAIMVALMTKEHQYKASDSFWCNVQHNEVKGKGYKAGGQPLWSVKLKKDSVAVYVTGDDLSWGHAKFTMRSVVLYFKHNGKIIGTTGFDFDCTVDDAVFTARWDERGIISEAFPDIPPEFLNYYFNKENGND